MSDAVAKARAAWGAEIPDWVLRLAEECAATSQNKAAARMKRSASLVSTVLGRTYSGDMAAVEEVVRGIWFRQTVDCPAQGEISTAACRDWMALSRSFNPINSDRVRMYRACRSCPRMQKEVQT